jgi:lipopolysaccharide transport system ATP-binding protein
MMSDPAIAVEKLSKKYLVGHKFDQRKQGHTTLRDVIARETRNFARKGMELLRGGTVVQGDEVEEFWALKHVSFEVKKGEAVGIIGRNGAGKSTLLKILSRITEPTEGKVRLQGRVASLLEVGTGFHSELSGRENIFLNGAILGMKRAEIRQKFDEIVSFADVEKFLDTPVKRYSSGMYVRLAFAVAAHMEPDILIVDEVLAVGDAEFQKKCLGKMDEVSRLRGRTVLFVSHNMGVITNLCTTAFWLDQGTIRKSGSARDVVHEYMAMAAPSQDQIFRLDSLPRPHYVEDDRLRVESVEWLCGLPLQHGEPVIARVNFKTRSAVADVTLAIGFSSVEGKRLLTYETDFPDGLRPSISNNGAYSVEFHIDSLPLAPDIYGLDIGSRSGDFHPLDYMPLGVLLDVVPGPKTPGYLIRKDAGVRLACKCSWKLGS